MTQLFTNNAEGGTQGTTPTASNSGGASGDAMSISVGSGNTAIFDSAAAAHGLLGYTWTFGGTTSGFMQWVVAGSGRTVFRFYVRVPVTPTGVTYLGAIRNSSGNMVVVGTDTSGHLRLQNATGAILYTAANLLPTGWLRVEVAVTPGTTTSNGRAEIAYYSLDSATAFETPYDSGTTANTGTTPAAYVRAGQITVGQSGTMQFDDLQAANLTTGWIGPVTAPAPVLVANNRARYLIDYTATTGTGPFTYTIVQNSGATTTPTVITPGLWEVVQSTTEALVYTVTVTDANGTPSTDTVSVPIAATGSTTNVSAPLQWDTTTSAWE